MVAWQRCGMKERVEIAPPAVGADGHLQTTRVVLGGDGGDACGDVDGGGSLMEIMAVVVLVRVVMLVIWMLMAVLLRHSRFFSPQ